MGQVLINIVLKIGRVGIYMYTPPFCMDVNTDPCPNPDDGLAIPH